MQVQLRLRWLLRRACTPGVLKNNQLGVTVHALRQLDLLTLSASFAASPIFPVIGQLCEDADGRSQANVLHTLAIALKEDCSVRVVVGDELTNTLRALQEHLRENADRLTASETVLVMEALLRLMPYQAAGTHSSLVHPQLLEEVQERAMALASVVERPVDLLGVTRIIVQAAAGKDLMGAAEVTPDSEPRLASSAWSAHALEHVLRELRMRLSTFSKQDLLAVVDCFTVRPRSRLGQDLCSSFDAPQLDREKTLLPPQKMAEKPVDQTHREVAGSVHSVGFLEVARPLLADVMTQAVTTVPSLSVSQLCAWLTRLVALRLTEYPLFLTVLRRLGSMNGSDFTVQQLANAAGALAELLSRTPESGDVWEHAELCWRILTRLLTRLSTTLHGARRDDPEVAAEVQACLLPLMSRLPEATLDQLVSAAMLDTAPSDSNEQYSKMNAVQLASLSSSIVSHDSLSFCAELASALERSATLLLRYMNQFPVQDQADIACIVFRWRIFMPWVDGATTAADQGHVPSTSARNREKRDDSSKEIGNVSLSALSKQPQRSGQPKRLFAGSRGPNLKSRDVLQRSSPLTLKEIARKHRALCGLVTASSVHFSATDAVQVLNELVVAHFVDHAAAEQAQHRRYARLSLSSAAEEDCAVALSDAERRERVARRAVEERRTLMQHLHSQLQGPLQNGLKDVHTVPLVRYLNSLSKMGVGAKKSYAVVLEQLKGRSLTSLDHMRVLEVLARHHVKSRYLVCGAVRALLTMNTVLSSSEKAFVLKKLGQVQAQRFVKAPCDPILQPGAFFLDPGELHSLTMLELVAAFCGLVQLRQYDNVMTQEVLEELQKRVQAQAQGESHATASRMSLHSIQSATLLAELLASLCRLGPPDEGVCVTLLAEVLSVLRQRLSSSKSLFVDLAQLNWHWPLVEPYLNPQSALWNRRSVVTVGAGVQGQLPFTANQWTKIMAEFALFRETAHHCVEKRLMDIAQSATLRPNTFLWGQLVSGLRYNGLPPRGSLERKRLYTNVEGREMSVLTGIPQQLLDVTVLGLHFLTEGEITMALTALRFVKKHVAAMRVQDSLQLWWYTSQKLAEHPRGLGEPFATAGESFRHGNSPKMQQGLIQDADPADAPRRATALRLLRELRDAAKEQVYHEEKSAMSKLSVMEKQLLEFLQ